MSMARGRGSGGNYAKVINGLRDHPNHGKWNEKTHFVELALEKPLHWKKARRIFVCSMGDLFHESVPFEWIDKVFAVMALCPQHTFQVLTKRPARMAEYIDSLDQDCQYRGKILDFDAIQVGSRWPLENLWLGVTAENQEMADKRIPILLQIPAAKRFVSVEPMLGPVDLEALAFITPLKHKLLDWVIIGAESGPNRRKCECEWVDGLKIQCQQAGVPVFVKQIHYPLSKELIKAPAGWPREMPK